MGICYYLVDIKNKRIFDLYKGMSILSWISGNSVQELKKIILETRIKHYGEKFRQEEEIEIENEYWEDTISDIWAFIQTSGKDNIELRHDHMDYYEKDPEYPWKYSVCYTRCPRLYDELDSDPFAAEHKIFKEQALKELKENFKIKFDQLKNEWLADIIYESSLNKIISHAAYQKIITMGKMVIPLILQDLEKRPKHWGPALQILTGANPISKEDAGNLKAITVSWFCWASKNNYKW